MVFVIGQACLLKFIRMFAVLALQQLVVYFYSKIFDAFMDVRWLDHLSISAKPKNGKIPSGYDDLGNFLAFLTVLLFNALMYLSKVSWIYAYASYMIWGFMLTQWLIYLTDHFPLL